MNNRYLYRAKRKNWRELPKEVWWVEGYYVFVDNHHYIYTGNLCNGGLYVVAERFEIDIATLCACTGLKDKNGKLIFENDIVEIGEHEDSVNGLYKVIYCENIHCYALERSIDFHYNFFTFSALNGFETSSNVIGNIFDNPELLEVGE